MIYHFFDSILNYESNMTDTFLKGKESDLFIHSRNNIYVMIYADDMLGCFNKDAHRSTLCHLTILLLHAKLYFINSCK
jgi:hypothetical protein